MYGLYHDNYYTNLRLYLYLILLIIVSHSQVYAQNPKESIININNITSWVRDDGFHNWNVFGVRNGNFPKLSNSGVMFSEGIVWGGKVFDGNNRIIRVNGSNFISGNTPITRLYRVMPDYKNVDLTSDATTFFNVKSYEVTDEMRGILLTQYEKDWEEWPGNKGAPFYDGNNDGKYNPVDDIPGIPGADQTLWLDYSDSNSYKFAQSPPVGIETQETYWAYNYSGHLGNIIFKRVKFIYNGLPESKVDSYIDSMYLVQAANPEIGHYGDDFAGSDTSLNLGYAYNARYPVYHLGEQIEPIAVGYSFLQGPSYKTNNLTDSAIVNFNWEKGYKYFHTKLMSTFIYSASGGRWGSPGNDYDGIFEWYNHMRGYLPIPRYPSGQKFTRPAKFTDNNGPYDSCLLNGDPVTGTGWIDGVHDTPSVRHFYVITGPFSMKLHDTVEVVIAMVGGIGSDNLNAITKIRKGVEAARLMYFGLVDDITNNKTYIPITKVVPENYVLTQNYPNPFNGFTTIKYECPKEANVKLIIYDLLGRKVKTLLNGNKVAGTYEEKFNPGNLSSGMYFYKISFENSDSKLVYDKLTKVKKMILMK